MNKIKKISKKLFSYQQIRFLFVGGINTLIGYGSYALFLYLGLNYIIANTLATIIGILNSYLWNRKFTFKSKANVKKEILKFIAVYAVSYILGLIAITLFVKKIGMNEYIAGLLNLIVTTLISWFGHKYFSFKNREKKEIISSIDITIILIIFFSLFISFIFGDILTTTNHSLSFVDLLFKGELKNLYAANYFPKAGYFAGSAIAYDFEIIGIMGIWNIPNYFFSKMLSTEWVYNFFSLIWAKGILLVFLAGSICYCYKICKLYEINQINKKLFTFLFISSPIIMFTITMFSGYDIISVFFTLMGIYYYLKNKNVLFLISFSIAISLKLFALLVFIPLILLKEKNLFKCLLQLCGGLAVTILGKLLWLSAPKYLESTSSFSNSMIAKLFSHTIDSPFSGISLFFLLLFAVYIICYFIKVKKEDIKYYAIYICFIVYAIFSTCVEIHPQWLILMCPYTVLILFLNKNNFRKNLLLNIGMNVGFILTMSVYYSWVFCTSLLDKMAIYKLLDFTTQTGDIIIFEKLNKYSSSFTALSFVCILIFAYINFPKKWKKSEIDELEHQKDIKFLLWIRALIIPVIALIIVFYYIKRGI